MAFFIAFPLGALLFAAAFALVWFYRRRPLTGWTAIAWAGYAVYEYLMYTRVLCSGECNIRVDLLLIYPVLLGMSLLAILKARVSGVVNHVRKD